LLRSTSAKICQACLAENTPNRKIVRHNSQGKGFIGSFVTSFEVL
jgi:hypothetical protein